MFSGGNTSRPPTKMSHQNGLAERSVRALKAAFQSISINEGHPGLTQNTITLAVIAKNHAPRAVTGLPPAYAMTGRCDVASGAATCTLEHDPLSHDSLIPQANAVRKIIDARNEIMKRDSEHAIRTALNQNVLSHWFVSADCHWQRLDRNFQSHCALRRKFVRGARE